MKVIIMQFSALGTNEFTKGYQPKIKIIEEENGDLLAYPQSVLDRWKNIFNPLLNVRGIHDLRKMNINMAETLVPEPSLVIAIGKLKRYKSLGTGQIPAELIKAGGETLYSEIHERICSIWNKEELHSSGRNLLLYQFIKWVKG
jgi:hypothetical protein